MVGKQAKILSNGHIDDLLAFAETTRQPLRNKLMILLSAKAGLRAGEIANLTWAMVTDPTGAIGATVQLPDRAAKKGGGRAVPLHDDLRATLMQWCAMTPVNRADNNFRARGTDEASQYRSLVREHLSHGRL